MVVKNLDEALGDDIYRIVFCFSGNEFPKLNWHFVDKRSKPSFDILEQTINALLTIREAVELITLQICLLICEVEC